MKETHRVGERGGEDRGWDGQKVKYNTCDQDERRKTEGGVGRMREG